jgi:hypothetical protein
VSYSEENGQVVLRMSREDYSYLLFLLGGSVIVAVEKESLLPNLMAFTNRLNEGNPNYTPYQVPDK